MENQEPAPNPTPPAQPLDSAPVVFKYETLGMILGILLTAGSILFLVFLVTTSRCCDPAVPRSPADNLLVVLLMSILICPTALATIYTCRYKLILSPESITVVGLWKPTTIRTDQITRFQWITGKLVIVHSVHAKITIGVDHFGSDRFEEILDLLKKYYADKPQDDLELALDRDKARAQMKHVPVSFAIPLIIIVLFIAFTTAAYLAYQITIALVMAILGGLPLIYVIWSEMRHRSKAAETNSEK